MNHRRDLNEFEREQHRKAPKEPHPYGELHLAIIALACGLLTSYLLYREAILPWGRKSEIAELTAYTILLFVAAGFCIFSYIRRASGKEEKLPEEPEKLRRGFLAWAAACVLLLLVSVFVVPSNAGFMKVVVRGIDVTAFVRASQYFKAYRKAKAEVGI